MLDFVKIKTEYKKKSLLEIYPDFTICSSKDLMVRSKSFYAIWDEEARLWSKDEYKVQDLVDKELQKEYKKQKDIIGPGVKIDVKYMRDFSTRSWFNYKTYINNLSDNYKDLDNKIMFLNQDTKKTDYASRRLDYPLGVGSYEAWDRLISTLYLEDERHKIEWAIGSIIAGDSLKIQKFLVFFGDSGTGKSTILNIIQKLFRGYYTTFEAKALTQNNNTFATEAFKNNPLVAIQHDGDLSNIEDNSKLNSIVSHEEMVINEKYKASYTSKINCMLFMGTNKPVKITDSKSGIIRRLIDIKPTGNKIPIQEYNALYSQIDFELGAIAYHCLQVYKKAGANYYDIYVPNDMISQTNVIYNFLADNYFVLKEMEYITVKQLYDLYKQYASDTELKYLTPMYKFKYEVMDYFEEFSDRKQFNGERVRSVFLGFKFDKFLHMEEKETPVPELNVKEFLEIGVNDSIFDDIAQDYPAQYANSSGTPSRVWKDVTTTLKDIDTSKLHYVQVPNNHIIIDFDIKNEQDEKDLEANLKAASKFPKTYAEYSKSGKGVHLHYIYDGDTDMLSRIFDTDIEVKVYNGNASLRRQLTKCNSIDIKTINSGLPLKGEKKVLNFTEVKSEQSLRNLILRNLNKEIHDATKPSIDFIHKILSDAYASDLTYDVSDMAPKILAFANNSTNQSDNCVKIVSTMKFKSEEQNESSTSDYKSDKLIFFDVEVFPNLFIVVWKPEDGEHKTMINPTPLEIGELLEYKLVGFNCRRYDNHILYGRYIGYSNEELYKLSQNIVNNKPNSTFAKAYSLSYTDVFDFSNVKQSLKRWEIDLDLHHQELGLPWEEPVPEEQWELVADYCKNDVTATEEVFKNRKEDFVARQILAALSGLTVNDTNRRHAEKIIFGDDKNPSKQFKYTDLSKEFIGYEYDMGVSTYRGEVVGEGGYVYSEPGMYENVALLDVASMHPTSLINMDVFGPYTKNVKALLDTRLYIKHNDLEAAGKEFNGLIGEHLNDIDPEALSYALKIIINSIYGYTAASFDNPFRDRRNKDNIVAKRGALFMIDLKHAVQEKGFTVAHIKTDSIKIPDATPEIIDFITEFGTKYGYTFEHEDTYQKMCLVNDSVFINKNKKGEWEATGAQFAHPYVFKTLFSKEPLEFKDLCEVKTVTTALYLNFNENLPEGEDNLQFVGKAGQFTPVKEGTGGGLLLRQSDDKFASATGAKGYRWKESESMINSEAQDEVDYEFFDKLVDAALEKIGQFGDTEWFRQ